MTKKSESLLTPEEIESYLKAIGEFNARCVVWHMLIQEKLISFPDTSIVPQHFDVITTERKSDDFIFDEDMAKYKGKYSGTFVISMPGLPVQIVCEPQKNTEDFKVFCPETNIAIVPKIKSKERIYDFLKKDAFVKAELCIKAYLLLVASKFRKTKGNKTDFIKAVNNIHTGYLNFYSNCHVNNSYHQLMDDALITLTEITRKTLYNILIEHDWNKFAPTQNQAKEILKQNKNLIYQYAQDFGYINNAKRLIYHQKNRDTLAHPGKYINRMAVVKRDTYETIIDFTNVIRNLTKTKFIVGICTNPEDSQPEINIWPEVANYFGINKQFNFLYVYNVPREWLESIIASKWLIKAPITKEIDLIKYICEHLLIDTLGQIDKPLKTKELLEYIKENNILSQNDIAELSNLISSRNSTAHEHVEKEVNKTVDEIDRANQLLQKVLEFLRQKNDIKFSNSNSVAKDEYGDS